MTDKVVRTSLLFPQLPALVAETLSSEIAAANPSDLARSKVVSHPTAFFTATGGSRVSELDLLRLQNRLRGVASLGLSSSKFDGQLTVVLREEVAIATAEGMLGGVWAFIACILAPDVVRTRFPGTDSVSPVERFLGGRRNTFFRLWWRSRVLEEGANGVNLDLFGEDEIVQLMERPQLSSVPALARATASGLLIASATYSHVSRRTLIRESQKRLLRLSAYTDFGSLSHTQLSRMVTMILHDVATQCHDG